MEYHIAQARSIIHFLKEPLVESLYRCNPIYFFVDNLWDKVPADWQIALSKCSIHELSLLSTGYIKDEFPDSFTEFLKRTRDIALIREQITNYPKNKIFNTYNLNPKKEHELTAMGPMIKSICDRLDISWCIDIGAGKGYLSQMLVHQYGINVLALDQSDNNVQKSIKIGEREANLEKKRRKDKLKNKTNNNKNNENNDNDDNNIHAGKYVAAKLKLTKNTTLDEILELARDPNTEKEIEKDGDNEKERQKLFGGNFLLTGLHCCGGLSPTILRMFANNDYNNENKNNQNNNNNNNNNWKMKGVFLLSCCYHLVQEEVDVQRMRERTERLILNKEKEDIAEDKEKEVEMEKEKEVETEKEREKEEEERIDFPLSDFVACSGVTLGRAARLLACYAADKWPTNPQQLRKSETAHAFRAALQVLLLQHYKEFCENNDTAVGHIGETHSKDFYSYAKFSISQKLKLPWNPLFSEEYLAKFWAEYESKLSTISMFWNLRAIVGPVIESLILLDRQLYLEEKGISASLVPIFDPCISPRNVAIIAP